MSKERVGIHSAFPRGRKCSSFLKIWPHPGSPILPSTQLGEPDTFAGLKSSCPTCWGPEKSLWCVACQPLGTCGHHATDPCVVVTSYPWGIISKAPSGFLKIGDSTEPYMCYFFFYTYIPVNLQKHCMTSLWHSHISGTTTLVLWSHCQVKWGGGGLNTSTEIPQ